MALSDVSSILWRERELLELLLFKLEEEQLLLAAGRSRWLASATREVEVVLEQIRRAEFARSVEVAAVTAELGLDEPPSLTRLAEVTSPPWDEIFRDHRAADFAALNTALSALYASRRAIEVTGQNLANVNTEGYSRQRVDLQANQGPVLPALFSRWPGGGAGVTVAGVVRLRDDLLDARAQREHGVQARTTATQTTYAYLEQTLTEPSDNGLQQQLSEFWAGWDDVGNHPEEPAPRSQLVQRAATLANGFNQAAEAFAAQWGSAREQLGAIVDDVNATAKNIAALNDSIKTATVAGNSPNELADRRDALVLHLADLIGATARPGESGTVDVSLGGSPLVTGARSETLAVSGAATFADVPATPVTVTWSADGSQAAVGDGQAAGLLDALDVVLPRYRAGLDAVAKAVASTVNAAQAAGYDSAGDRGTEFFGGTTAASAGRRHRRG